MKRIFLILLLLLMMVKTHAVVDKENKTQRDPFMRATQLVLSRENLQDYPLEALKLVGTVHKSSQKLAVVSDSKNRLYTLKIGDLIGLEQAKITQILADEVVVEWIVQRQVFTDYLRIFRE